MIQCPCIPASTSAGASCPTLYFLEDRSGCDVQVGVRAWSHSLALGPHSTSSGPCSWLSEFPKALATTSLLSPFSEPTLLRGQGQSEITFMPSFLSLPKSALLFSQEALSIAGSQLTRPFLFALVCVAPHQSTIAWPFLYSQSSSKITSLGKQP